MEFRLRLLIPIVQDLNIFPQAAKSSAAAFCEAPSFAAFINRTYGMLILVVDRNQL
jgi:hypothetical protein